MCVSGVCRSGVIHVCVFQVWDIRSGSCIETLYGHTDEVLDIGFDHRGKQLLSVSADATG